MDRQSFLDRVAAYHQDGWRLSIINATSVLPDDELTSGACDVTWSFAKGTEFETLRERVLPGEELPSVSLWYSYAFTYENEMRELFGIDVTGMRLDLGGQLYKTATKVPFSPSAIRARLEASGRLEHGAKHEAKPAPVARPVPAPPGDAVPKPPVPTDGQVVPSATAEAEA